MVSFMNDVELDGMNVLKSIFYSVGLKSATYQPRFLMTAIEKVVWWDVLHRKKIPVFIEDGMRPCPEYDGSNEYVTGY